MKKRSNGMPLDRSVLQGSYAVRALIAKNSRSVPDAVVAAADVVSVLALRRVDGAPMSGGLPPAMDAIGTRVHQILVRPAFGNDLARHPMHPKG